ncbi:hypothetical protein BHE74_00005622 [Ensete ventricosum]|nr:hypothetical protein BHE74_00005622 [Ensete ventricosum]
MRNPGTNTATSPILPALLNGLASPGVDSRQPISTNLVPQQEARKEVLAHEQQEERFHQEIIGNETNQGPHSADIDIYYDPANRPDPTSLCLYVVVTQVAENVGTRRSSDPIRRGPPPVKTPPYAWPDRWTSCPGGQQGEVRHLVLLTWVAEARSPAQRARPNYDIKDVGP